MDPRVFPEKLLSLGVGEAFVFRTVAGHPQAAMEDIAVLDINSHDGVKEIMVIYHTGLSCHRESKRSSKRSRRNRLWRCSVRHAENQIVLGRETSGEQGRHR